MGHRRLLAWTLHSKRGPHEKRTTEANNSRYCSTCPRLYWLEVLAHGLQRGVSPGEVRWSLRRVYDNALKTPKNCDCFLPGSWASGAAATLAVAFQSLRKMPLASLTKSPASCLSLLYLKKHPNAKLMLL